MTLLVVIILGAGMVLIASAIETDKTTGKSVSIIQTIKDIWNGGVDFSQPSMSQGFTMNDFGPAPDPKNYAFGVNDPQFVIDNGVWFTCTTTGVGAKKVQVQIGGPNQTTPQKAPPTTPTAPSTVTLAQPVASTFVGGAHPSLLPDQAALRAAEVQNWLRTNPDAYRASVVRAWVQSKRDGTI